MSETTEVSIENALSGKRVALAVCGGIAAYKSVEILRGLQRAGCEVRVTMTRHACEFVTPLTFRALSGSHVVVDDYSLDNPDPIAHINFSQTVDLFVVAPATANIIAKFANGIADDFVTSTYLACTAPVLIAPAMNPTMWLQAATRRNVDLLRADGVHFVEPDSGEMACGTVGPGRLSEPEIIVQAALELLNKSGTQSGGSMKGERVLITAGATREEIDPVRFVSNRSSGRMGFAIAEAAAQRGADVTIVAGFTTAPSPAGARIIRVGTAEEMANVVLTEVAKATVFVAAAAVADYRPVTKSAHKLKKKDQTISLVLERTPDVLSLVSQKRISDLIVVGFAAETSDVQNHARRKLEDKKLDMIVANDVSLSDSGFDSLNNTVTIITADDPNHEVLPTMSKPDAARRILDRIELIRRHKSAVVLH
jgi:phosphopantothenoylcysteine decarboxylase/phosphopantothenate--cysteine ligase